MRDFRYGTLHRAEAGDVRNALDWLGKAAISAGTSGRRTARDGCGRSRTPLAFIVQGRPACSPPRRARDARSPKASSECQRDEQHDDGDQHPDASGGAPVAHMIPPSGIGVERKSHERLRAQL